MNIVSDVASIVQLIDFSTEVFLRLKDYCGSRKGSPKIFRNIENQLPLLIDDLARLKQTSQANFPALSTASRDALKAAVDGCKSEIESLNALLGKLMLPANASRRQRVGTALLSIYKEKEICAVWNEVQSFRSALTHHLVPATALPSTSTYPAEIPGLYDIPPIHVPHFVPRPALIASIDSMLRRSPSASGRSAVVVLLGMGGQGKTQLALEHCNISKVSGKMKAIFWVDASSRKSVQRGMEAIAKKLAPGRIFNSGETAIAIFVRQTLSSMQDEWLMVFDNFDDPLSFPDIQDFFPQCAYGSIIVTSRHNGCDELGQVIRVDRMETTEGLQLLLRSREPTSEELPFAKRILTLLGDLPLAIDQARAYISSRQLSLFLFLTEYEQRKSRILKETPHLTVYRRKLSQVDKETCLSVFTTWEMSLSQLRSSGMSTPDLTEILTLFGVFHPFSISEALLCIPLNNHIGDASPLSAFLDRNQWNHLEFEDAIKQMQTLSLLQFARQGETEIIVSLHPLISEWLKLRIDNIELTRYLSIAALHVAAYLDLNDNDGISFANRQQLILHIDRISGMVPSQSYIFINPNSWQSFGKFLNSSGQYDEAEKMYERARAGFEAAFGQDHLLTLTTIDHLGLLYRNQERLKDAERMYELALVGKEKVVGVDAESTLITVDNLGVLYADQGRLSEAEQVFERALAGKEKVLGPNHVSTLITVDNLGGLYLDSLRLESAEQMYMRALVGREMVLGPNHARTLTTVHNLGFLYHAQRRLGEARQRYHQALTGFEITLGPKHPWTLTAAHNLGILYFEEGQMEAAEHIYKRSLAGTEQSFGSETPWSLTIVSELGNLYRHSGRLEEAEETYKRSLAGYERIMGLDHIRTLSEAGKLRDLHDEQSLKEADRVLKKRARGQGKGPICDQSQMVAKKGCSSIGQD